MKDTMLYTLEQDKISKYAKAMAHPARVFILNYLLENESCYAGDIVAKLPMAQSSASQHLRELKIAGLIKGKNELPKIKYSIEIENWKEASKLFGGFFN
ncbi:ArsR/SmtB family transcription factor [Sediminitomix flava]|uniref:DNA-binding transcriptional ArsR family regulator n=1 Tax=Sediminitomix flava TaxID=379075 RepID=A0A315Z209_SEDFL|nr:metalloregulator ArsR/SmtB family transcription factor [Sediminitomix flava]PWJ36090.1 DNA-binding transcriptional ArsR family regulator [Sediminitomix flava]